MNEQGKQKLIAFFEEDQKRLARLSNEQRSIFLSQASTIAGQVVDSLKRGESKYAQHELESLENNLTEKLGEINLSDEDKATVNCRLEKVREMISLL